MLNGRNTSLCLRLGWYRMIGLIILIAWIIILMTRMIAKMSNNAMEYKENNYRGAAEGRAFVFLISPGVFAYFANNPSHWDGNPGIGIVNPYNPKQSQLKAEAWTTRNTLKITKQTGRVPDVNRKCLPPGSCYVWAVITRQFFKYFLHTWSPLIGSHVLVFSLYRLGLFAPTCTPPGIKQHAM